MGLGRFSFGFGVQRAEGGWGSSLSSQCADHFSGLFQIDAGGRRRGVGALQSLRSSVQAVSDSCQRLAMRGWRFSVTAQKFCSRGGVGLALFSYCAAISAGGVGFPSASSPLRPLGST